MTSTAAAQPAARQRSGWLPRLTLFGSLRGYRREWLDGDLVAGLTVWAVLVPESLAYATIAGVSPVVGLYAAPAALILYAAFGSSRHVVTGPMAATAALSAAVVADLVTGGVSGDPDEFASFTILLALMTGVLALLAGLLRLGFLANFISEPVLKGFIIGLALTIIVGQLPKLLGIEKEEGNFFEQAWHVLTHLADTQWRTLTVGLASLLIVFVLREVAPRVPASLVAVLFGIGIVDLLDLGDKGVAIVGTIDSGLPSFGLPDVVDFSDYLAAAGAAVGVMFVGFAESLGAGKTYAARNHYDIDADRELLGLGAANIGSGLSSGMVVNGSLSKTAVNGSAGAHTQLSGIICAALTVITLLFLTGLFEQLPEATLAAVVIAALVELVDFPSLAALHRLYTRRLGRIYGHAARPDFIAAVAALLGVLVFDTLPGLFIGITVSVLLLIYRASRPNIAELGEVPGAPGQFGDIDRHPENQPPPGIVIARVEGGLFFANADAVRDALRDQSARPGVTGLILDAASVPFVDVTAVRMLAELSETLAATSVRLVVAADLGQVRDLIGEDPEAASIPVYPTIDAAVRALDG